MSSHAAAETREATYPAFQGEPHYLEGYRPVSYDSPHSSLHLAETWLGMGLIVASGILATVLRAKTVAAPPAEEL